MKTFSQFALDFVGTKQGDKRHKQIIDGYNNKCNPLPRGYRVKYSDNWCATFVSYVLTMCNAINPPLECSCYYMTKLATKNKQIVKTPKINDLIIYDWGNNGTLDHVGIIYKIVGNTLYVVEGNKSKQVGTRTIDKSNKEIECFIRVKQEKATPATATPATKTINLEKVAKDVIKGVYGDGQKRKDKITSLGYDYKEVQKLVNEILKKS